MLVQRLVGKAAADAILQSMSYKPGEPSCRRASYLVMGHALGLGDELSAAHFAVTFSE